MQVKLRQLRALDAVVRVGSFVDAARALHVSPAALSLAIRDLEESLGFRVLERTTRRLRLTEAGRGYLPFAQRIVSELAEADRYVREVRQGRGIVRIATTQAVIGTLLAAVLPELHARWPRLRLQPLDVASSGIADTLLARQADVAIGVRLPTDPQFDTRRMFASRWMAYVAAAHPLRRRKRIGWDELARHPLLMSRSAQLDLQGRLGDAPRLDDVADAPTVSAGLAMATTGTAAAVFPGYAQPLAHAIGLRALPIDRPAIPHELQIACARQPSTAAPLRELCDLLIDAVERRCQHLR